MAYATVTDLDNLTIPGVTLEEFTTEQKEYALDVASSEADGYLSTRYVPPFTTWPLSLRMHVAKMAVYYLMTSQGFNPDAESNQLIVLGHDTAIEWLRRVAKGEVTLPLSSTSQRPAQVPQFESCEPRGY